MVTEAAAEFVKQQRQMELQDTQVYIDKLKESGMQVNTLTPEEKTAFKEALAPMYELSLIHISKSRSWQPRRNDRSGLAGREKSRTAAGLKRKL